MTAALDDDEAMRIAITVADDARLVSRPNPWVGAVIVAPNGEVFNGATSRVGGPHAEIVALRAAGGFAYDSTLYTTLEPCDHTGRTSPCTEAIIDAGVKRVVVGIQDPDENVSGRGLERLRNAGLTVDIGTLAAEIRAQLAAYLHHRKTKRPYVVLKMAATLDGRTSAPDGTSVWITGDDARLRVQQLRAQSDAVLVGAGTVRTDDPQLTVRDVDGDSPRRVVLGNVSDQARVNPCTQWTGSLVDLLDTLGGQNVLQLLVEGGPRVATSFHREGLINQYILHLAPAFSGGSDSLGVFEGFGIQTMADLWRGRITSTQRLGSDLEVIIEPNIRQEHSI